IIHYGDADDFTVDRAGVITPGRQPAPAILFADFAFCILNLAVMHLFANGIADTDPERALFGISEADWNHARAQIDVKNNQACLAEIIEVNDSFLIEQLTTVSHPPFVMRGDPAVVVSHYRWSDLEAYNLPPPFSLRPEVDSLYSLDLLPNLRSLRNHIAVAKPQRLLVHVIERASLERIFHRPRSRHRPPPRT